MLIFFEFFFGVIWSLSLLKEIKRLNLWERFPGLMQFIPTWSFFAPTPNMYDYHLLYREILNTQEVQEWKVALDTGSDRRKLCFIWHPEKKFSKSLLDLAIDLGAFSEKVKDKKQICLSTPYLHLLNFVDALCSKNAKVQFAILTNSRIHSYEVSFLSEVHPTRAK